MVKLVIKKGDQPQFLIEASSKSSVNDIVELASEIYNFRLKVFRIADELKELAEHGVSLPPYMQGLTEDQVIDLKLKDEWGDKCIPSGGFVENKDEIGRRNGKSPKEHLANVLLKSRDEAKSLIHKDLISKDKILTKELVHEAFMILKGAVTIVYPMGLPPYDPIELEFKNEEDLTGTQAQKEVIPSQEAVLWFSGKEMLRTKLLSDYVGANEKSRLIIKLSKRGSGAPAREAIICEADQRAMMAYYHRRQEELKKLEENEDDSYLNSAWSEPGQLKRQFHGLSNIKWGP